MKLKPWQIDVKIRDSINKVATLENGLFAMIVDCIKRNVQDNQLEDMKSSDWKQAMFNNTELNVTSTALITSVMNEVTKDLSYQIKNKDSYKSKSFDTWINKQAKQGNLKRDFNSSSSRKVINKHLKNDPKYLRLARNNMKKNTYSLYRKVISDAIVEFQGSRDISTQEAIVNALKKSAQIGVPALIDSAGKEWSPEVYTRLVMANSLNQVSSDFGLSEFTDSGGKLVRVSSHAASRPSHRPFQDNIYCLHGETSDYPNIRVTGYGGASGIGGINCRHYLIPYVPGAGEFNPAPKVSDKENDRVYQLTQKQRALERGVRRAKRQEYAAEQLGNDRQIGLAKQTVRTQQAHVRGFVRDNDLTRQYEREQIY